MYYEAYHEANRCPTTPQCPWQHLRPVDHLINDCRVSVSTVSFRPDKVAGRVCVLVKISELGLGVWLGKESFLFIMQGSDLHVKVTLVSLRNPQCG